MKNKKIYIKKADYFCLFKCVIRIYYVYIYYSYTKPFSRPSYNI